MTPDGVQDAHDQFLDGVGARVLVGHHLDVRLRDLERQLVPRGVARSVATEYLSEPIGGLLFDQAVGNPFEVTGGRLDALDLAGDHRNLTLALLRGLPLVGGPVGLLGLHHRVGRREGFLQRGAKLGSHQDIERLRRCERGENRRLVLVLLGVLGRHVAGD